VTGATCGGSGDAVGKDGPSALVYETPVPGTSPPPATAGPGARVSFPAVAPGSKGLIIANEEIRAACRSAVPVGDAGMAWPANPGLMGERRNNG
jgi:hypothetical protein